MLPALSHLTLLGTILWLLAILSPLPMARYNDALVLFVPFDIGAASIIGFPQATLQSGSRGARIARHRCGIC